MRIEPVPGDERRHPVDAEFGQRTANIAVDEPRRGLPAIGVHLGREVGSRGKVHIDGGQWID